MCEPIRLLPPRLVDQCGAERARREFSEIVIVGSIKRDTLVQRPVPMHVDPSYPLQLRKMEIRVENVLQGSLPARVVTVFYFAFAGGFDGPQPLGAWRGGTRRMFWLRKDAGVLRTACDGWDTCTRGVYSGAHPHFTPDQRSPFMDIMADILLTRGEGQIDEDWFAGAISRAPGSEVHLLEKYRQLALTESGAVKAAACTLLWGEAHSQFGPTRTREIAETSIRQAGCNCTARENAEPDCGPESHSNPPW